MENLTKRQIRYICFRLQTEAEGGAKAHKDSGIMQYVYDIKEHMESQEDFGGWNKFAKTWDVDEKSPLVIVSRISSIQSDWNKVLKKEAKELPVGKKLLQNDLGKKVQARKKTQEVKSTKKTSFWDKLT